MKSSLIDPSELKIDPDNKNWTSPRSWGVWELSTCEATRKYREGNYPVRGRELVKEYGSAKLIALYLDKASAREHAKIMND